MLVVTADPAVARHCDWLGIAVLRQERDAGHSDAAAAGARAAQEAGAERVAMLPIDCPLLDPAELDAHLGQHPAHGPDRPGQPRHGHQRPDPLPAGRFRARLRARQLRAPRLAGASGRDQLRPRGAASPSPGTSTPPRTWRTSATPCCSTPSRRRAPRRCSGSSARRPSRPSPRASGPVGAGDRPRGPHPPAGGAPRGGRGRRPRRTDRRRGGPSSRRDRRGLPEGRLEGRGQGARAWRTSPPAGGRSSWPGSPARARRWSS